MKKNLPKIIFRRSWLYDKALFRSRSYKMPADRVLDAKVKFFEREWKKIGNKILVEISKATKLEWHEKDIVCYITAGVVPYSDPLTLSTKSNIETLTHELIHVILSEPENWKIIKKNWNKLMKEFSNESQVIKTHVLVHAIHTVIIKKLFGNKRLKMEMNAVPAYARSWEIVEKEGYQNIVKKLTKGL